MMIKIDPEKMRTKAPDMLGGETGATVVESSMRMAASDQHYRASWSACQCVDAPNTWLGDTQTLLILRGSVVPGSNELHVLSGKRFHQPSVWHSQRPAEAGRRVYTHGCSHRGLR